MFHSTIKNSVIPLTLEGTSGILNAPNPKQMIDDMIKSMIKAYNDRNIKENK